VTSEHPANPPIDAPADSPAGREAGEPRLGEIVEAMAELATTSEEPLDAVLRKIADLARRLARARYAALGVPDSEGRLVRFVVSGISQKEVEAIGHWPRGQGLLGALIRERRSIRLANIATDPRFYGFPPNHPVTTSFLGVPILWSGKVLGNLYIADKQGAPEFSAEDQRIIEALAAHAAVAIENVRLVADLRQLGETREEEIKLISHDLRAPLTIILGQAQMLTRLLDTGSVEAARRACDAIIRGTRRMNALIQDLVDAARLEARPVQLRPEPVNLASFAGDLTAHLAGVLPAERIRVETAPSLPLVSADPARLERILANLLSNALKYSPPESQITVRVQPGSPGEALVSVADLGIGIAADELPRLFQRFYRTRETGSTEGLGLGLYITRKLVEAHGGRIWAESPGPGQGATFYFTLPVTRANRRPAVKESGQRTGGAPCARSV